MVKRAYHCTYLFFKYNGEGQTHFSQTVVITVCLVILKYCYSKMKRLWRESWRQYPSIPYRNLYLRITSFSLGGASRGLLKTGLVWTSLLSLCLVKFWTSEWMEIPHPLWTTCCRAWLISCLRIQHVPLRGTWVCPIYRTLSSAEGSEQDTSG